MDQKLGDNMKQQAKRLLLQMQELEESKGDLDAEEYQSMKNEILEQMHIFQKGLDDLNSKNFTLNSEMQKAQEQIQDIIKQSYNTKELKQKITEKEVQGIRDKIDNLDKKNDLNKLPRDQYIKEKLELINQIQDIKAELTSNEKKFLDQHTGKVNFVQAQQQQNLSGQQFIKKAEEQMKSNKF